MGKRKVSNLFRNIGTAFFGFYLTLLINIVIFYLIVKVTIDSNVMLDQFSEIMFSAIGSTLICSYLYMSISLVIKSHIKKPAVKYNLISRSVPGIIISAILFGIFFKNVLFDQPGYDPSNFNNNITEFIALIVLFSVSRVITSFLINFSFESDPKKLNADESKSI